MVLDTLETLKEQEYFNKQNRFYSNFQSALENYNSGNYKNSLKQLTKIKKKIIKFSLDKEFIIATNIAVGNSYAKRREFSNAINSYNKVLKIDPNNIVAKNNLMLVFIEQGRYPEATAKEQELEKNIYSIKDPLICSSLGRYYLVVKKDLDKSLEYNLKAIGMGSETWIPYNEALFIYDEYKKDYSEAFKIYEMAKSKGYGEISDILNNYAYALLKYGKIQDAHNVLKKIDINLLSDRRKAVVTATWGLYYFKNEELEKGKRFYERAINLADNLFSNLVKQKYLLELGNYYYEKRDITLAETSWKESLSIDIDEKLFNYRKDILENLLKIEKTKELSENKYLIRTKVVSRYKKFALIFGISSLSFIVIYVLWMIRNIIILNPFFVLLGAFCSLVLFFTSVAGINVNEIQ